MEMQIEFRDRKKIITHPSGYVSEMTRENLENLKSEMEKQKVKIEEFILEIESDISKL